MSTAAVLLAALLVGAVAVGASWRIRKAGQAENLEVIAAAREQALRDVVAGLQSAGDAVVERVATEVGKLVEAELAERQLIGAGSTKVAFDHGKIRCDLTILVRRAPGATAEKN